MTGGVTLIGAVPEGSTTSDVGRIDGILLTGTGAEPDGPTRGTLLRRAGSVGVGRTLTGPDAVGILEMICEIREGSADGGTSETAEERIPGRFETNEERTGGRIPDGTGVGVGEGAAVTGPTEADGETPAEEGTMLGTMLGNSERTDDSRFGTPSRAGSEVGVA